MGNRKVLPQWPGDVELPKGKKCLLIGRRGAIAALSLMAREASGRQAAPGARFLPRARAAAQNPGTGVSPRGHPRRASGGRRQPPGFPESGAGGGGGPGGGSSWGRTTEGSSALGFHFAAAATEGEKDKVGVKDCSPR